MFSFYQVGMVERGRLLREPKVEYDGKDRVARGALMLEFFQTVLL